MIFSRWLKTCSIPVRALVWALAGLVWLAVSGIVSGQIRGASRETVVRARRTIDESPTGSHWFLIRDSVHPAGPGRLVNAPTGRVDEASLVPDQNIAPKVRDIRPPLQIVIRGGDALIVEDDDESAIVRLQAVALGPAAVGSEFQARLKIGGATIRVLALAPGRATIATQLVVPQ
jgi:hypothetical protein